MLSVTIPSHSDPSAYQLSTLAKPIINNSTDVIINVYAASINPIDVKKAGGALKLALSDEYIKLSSLCHYVSNEATDSLTLSDMIARVPLLKSEML